MDSRLNPFQDKMEKTLNNLEEEYVGIRAGLNTEPPGTAAEGWSPRKMISRMVSPIPITFRIVILIFLPDNHHDGVLNIQR